MTTEKKSPSLQREAYCITHSTPLSPQTREIKEHTCAHNPQSRMLIGEQEGIFLKFLLKSMQAQRVLELGTFTGFSALCFAEALGEKGEVHTIDIDSQTLKTAADHWAKSPAGDKIFSHSGPALEVIPTLKGHFDFIFIDADKGNYLTYLQNCLPLLTPRGVIAVDNVLWSDRVWDPEVNDRQTCAIRKLNEWVASNPTLFKVMLPLRDGIFLIQKEE